MRNHVPVLVPMTLQDVLNQLSGLPEEWRKLPVALSAPRDYTHQIESLVAEEAHYDYLKGGGACVDPAHADPDEVLIVRESPILILTFDGK